MRNPTRILCGFLSFLWLGDCKAPKVSLEVPLGDPEETRVRSRTHLVHLGSEAESTSLLAQLTSLSLNAWGAKTTHLPGSGHLRQNSHEPRVDKLHITSDNLQSSSMVARVTSTLNRVGLARGGAGDGIIMVAIAVIMLCFLGCLLAANEESDDDTPRPPDNLPKSTSQSQLPGLPSIKEIDSERSGSSSAFVRDHSDQQEQRMPSTPEQQPQQRQQSPMKNIFAEMKAAVGESALRNASQEDAQLTDVEFSDGSWARAYREARGQRREALELLFRCNIISTQEFAYSRVSQEHIDECVWIGTYMLKQKPLEEWVALWQQAQQTFEDSVTACFTARTDARIMTPALNIKIPRSDALLTPPRSGQDLGSSARAVMDCQTASGSQAYVQEGQVDPYETQGSLNMSQLLSQTAYPEYQGMASVPGSEGSLQAQNSSRGPGDETSQPRIVSPMILRCREIMNAPPQEGVPAHRSTPMRSSSSATAAPVFQPRPYSPSESSLTPLGSMHSLSPSLPSVSPPEPTTLPRAQPMAFQSLREPQAQPMAFSSLHEPQAFQSLTGQVTPPEPTILPSAARIMAQQAQQAELDYRAQLLSGPRSTPLAASMPSQQVVATTLPAEHSRPFAATLPPEHSLPCSESATAAYLAATLPPESPFAATLPPQQSIVTTLPPTLPPQPPASADPYGERSPFGTIPSEKGIGGHLPLGAGIGAPQQGRTGSMLSEAPVRAHGSEASIASSGGGPSSSNMPVIVTLPAAMLQGGPPAKVSSQSKSPLPRGAQQGSMTGGRTSPQAFAGSGGSQRSTGQQQ